MELTEDFSFQPLPPLEDPVRFPFPETANPLGPLAGLAGKWSGQGFNVIWRPARTAAEDRFLELNVTSEQLEFVPIPGPVPNRGLLQPDINMFGLTYLQQVSDANLNAGLHIEPGLWMAIPATSDPQETPTVARLASIPHGATVLAQGIADTSAAPAIADIDIMPFVIGNPAARIGFPEPNLATPASSRTAGAGLAGITQQMIDNPSTVLRSAIAGQHIQATTRLHVSTGDASFPNGRTASTAFLSGTAHGPNAEAAHVTATFWLETLQGDPEPRQLQYAQVVLLNFNGLSWPHVTVATLRKH